MRRSPWELSCSKSSCRGQVRKDEEQVCETERMIAVGHCTRRTRHPVRSGLREKRKCEAPSSVCGGEKGSATWMDTLVHFPFSKAIRGRHVKRAPSAALAMITEHTRTDASAGLQPNTPSPMTLGMRVAHKSTWALACLHLRTVPSHPPLLYCGDAVGCLYVPSSFALGVSEGPFSFCACGCGVEVRR